RDELSNGRTVEGLPDIREYNDLARCPLQCGVQCRGFSAMFAGVNKLDPLGDIFPDQKLGAVCRAVERNDDLQFAPRVIECEAILQLLFDILSLIVGRDDNAHRRLPIRFPHRLRSKAPPQHQESRVAQVDVDNENEAEPESYMHMSMRERQLVWRTFPSS